VSGATLDWAALAAKRDAYIERLNGIYSRNLDGAGIERVVGVASFTGPREVVAAGRTLTADHVLIAVGGSPSTLPIPGAELTISSDGFFDLRSQPRKALVVGAGYIAVEIAGILNAMGTETLLSCRGGGVLRRGFDPMVQRILNDELRRTGVGMKVETELTQVRRMPSGSLEATLSDGDVIDGLDCVLVAIGR
jgi:glutathione reductase (NADPH)